MAGWEALTRELDRGGPALLSGSQVGAPFLQARFMSGMSITCSRNLPTTSLIQLTTDWGHFVDNWKKSSPTSFVFQDFVRSTGTCVPEREDLSLSCGLARSVLVESALSPLWTWCTGHKVGGCPRSNKTGNKIFHLTCIEPVQIIDQL